MGEFPNEENAENNTPNILKRRKRRHILIMLLIVMVVLLLLILYLNHEYKLNGVKISGCSYYTEEEIKEKILTGVLAENTLGLYLLNKINEPSVPFVERIDIEMMNHHEILITVYEKSMIACIPYMNEYLYFDKDGIIVENSQRLMDYVPVIEGIQFSSMNLYEKLSVEDDNIFEIILNLSQLLKQYKIKTKSIYFNHNFEVVLYSGHIKVLLGNGSRYDEKIAELSNVIKKAKNRRLKGTLDMRSFEPGQPEIIFKEE